MLSRDDVEKQQRGDALRSLSRASSARYVSGPMLGLLDSCAAMPSWHTFISARMSFMVLPIRAPAVSGRRADTIALDTPWLLVVLFLGELQLLLLAAADDEAALVLARTVAVCGRALADWRGALLLVLSRGVVAGELDGAASLAQPDVAGTWAPGSGMPGGGRGSAPAV